MLFFREGTGKKKVRGVFVLISTVEMEVKSTLINYLGFIYGNKKKYVFVGEGV